VTGRWGRLLGTRGGIEVGLSMILGGLFAGLFFGTGLAKTVISTPDGLTWLPDSKRGEVVQVNPSTGTLEDRLKVASPGDPLDVTQEDNLLVTTDRRTGVVTVIDLSTLLISGQRQAGAGGSVKVLLYSGQIYLVERDAGTIDRLDPLTAALVGESWDGGDQLADAVVDGTGTVWALGQNGQLTALRWSDPIGRFVQQQTRPVNGTGPQAILVPHDKGVTVLGPQAGVVVAVGTGDDHVEVSARLQAPVFGADASPADLVAASSEPTSTVILVHGGQLVEADASALGCKRPGKPEPYRGLVYVPCLGDRKVIVLDPSGHQGGPDIVTPAGGDPVLVLDDGRLIVNVPGSDTGVAVDPNGSTRSVRIHDPSVPVHDPNVVPTSLPPGPLEHRSPHPSRSQGKGPAVGQPAPPSRTPSPPAAGSGPAPVGVAASARSDGSVLVSWTPGSGSADGYRILVEGSSETEAATAPASAQSAIVSSLTPGSSVSFVVEAQSGGTGYRSGRSNQVTVFARPAAPASLRASLTASSGSSATVAVNFDASSGNGSPVTAFDLSVSGGFTNSPSRWSGVAIGALPYSFTINCSGSCAAVALDIGVSATNGAGTGPSAQLHWTVPGSPPPSPAPPPPPPTTPAAPALPAAGATVITASDGYDNGDGTGEIDVTMSPPADWARYGGPCQLVGTRLGVVKIQRTIACSATLEAVTVTLRGTYSLVVRAVDPSNSSRYVDSAASTVLVTITKPQPCGRTPCNQLGGAPKPVPVLPMIAFPLALGLGTGLLRIRLNWRAESKKASPERKVKP
jgi:hypothetical protein